MKGFWLNTPENQIDSKKEFASSNPIQNQNEIHEEEDVSLNNFWQTTEETLLNGNSTRKSELPPPESFKSPFIEGSLFGKSNLGGIPAESNSFKSPEQQDHGNLTQNQMRSGRDSMSTNPSKIQEKQSRNLALENMVKRIKAREEEFKKNNSSIIRPDDNLHYNSNSNEYQSKQWKNPPAQLSNDGVKYVKNSNSSGNSPNHQLLSNRYQDPKESYQKQQYHKLHAPPQASQQKIVSNQYYTSTQYQSSPPQNTVQSQSSQQYPTNYQQAMDRLKMNENNDDIPTRMSNINQNLKDNEIRYGTTNRDHGYYQEATANTRIQKPVFSGTGISSSSNFNNTQRTTNNYLSNALASMNSKMNPIQNSGNYQNIGNFQNSQKSQNSQNSKLSYGNQYAGVSYDYSENEPHRENNFARNYQAGFSNTNEYGNSLSKFQDRANSNQNMSFSQESGSGIISHQKYMHGNAMRQSAQGFSSNTDLNALKQKELEVLKKRKFQELGRKWAHDTRSSPVKAGMTTQQSTDQDRYKQNPLLQHLKHPLPPEPKLPPTRSEQINHALGIKQQDMVFQTPKKKELMDGLSNRIRSLYYPKDVGDMFASFSLGVGNQNHDDNYQKSPIHISSQIHQSNQRGSRIMSSQPGKFHDAGYQPVSMNSQAQQVFAQTSTELFNEMAQKVKPMDCNSISLNTSHKMDLSDEEIEEKIELIFTAEPVKTEILLKMMSGDTYYDFELLRFLKKTRYMGSVAFGMIMYNLRESFGDELMIQNEEDSGNSFQISERLRILCQKVIEKSE